MSLRGLAAAFAILFATALSPTTAAARAPGKVVLHGNPREDAYIVSRGDHTMMTGGTIEDVQVARRRFKGAFLWVRRGGHEYVVHDARLIADAEGLFAPLKSLEPDRAALERNQRRLEEEESRLDREEKRLERELDRIGDDERSAARSESRDSLERRKGDLKTRRRALEERERELESADGSLDRREEELEKKAEAELWRFVDRAIEAGLARTER